MKGGGGIEVVVERSADAIGASVGIGAGGGVGRPVQPLSLIHI